VLVIGAGLATAACGTRTASVPALPPVPRLAMRGPAITTVQHTGLLRVASDLSYPPMAYAEAGAPRGFEIDLAGLLAGALGVRLEVVDTPVTTMRTAFPDGVDLLLSALPAGRAPGIPSTPYFVSREAILWRDGAAVRSTDALRGLRVAVAAGMSGETLVADAGALVVRYLPVDALSAVADGRAQAAVGDGPLLLDFAQTHPHLGVTAGPWRETPFVAVARPGAPDLAAFVSASIRDLRRSGGLDQLLRRWHL